MLLNMPIYIMHRLKKYVLLIFHNFFQTQCSCVCYQRKKAVFAISVDI